jgi:hypothetical protein
VEIPNNKSQKTNKLQSPKFKIPNKKTIALPPAHRAYGPEGTGLEFGV